jgi:diadenosine tetraphosphate (Ap4A) HIT family hydrolase
MNNKQIVIASQPPCIEDANVPWDNLVEETHHVRVYKDKYPVTEGHLLFVPRYNTVAVLMEAFEDAVRDGLKRVESNQWNGFNVGLNYGHAAGQTVEWPHVHLIPRRTGDMADPTGGVRHVIPTKGNYKKTK